MMNTLFNIHRLSNICMGIERQIQENEELFKQAKDELPEFVDVIWEFKGRQISMHIPKRDVLIKIAGLTQDLRCELTARKADLIRIVNELEHK